MIDSIPPVISHDEIYYVNEAQTVALSGSDLSGQWHPWHLTPSHPLFAELPGTVMSAGFILFPNAPFMAAKFVYLLAGTLLPLVLAGIVLELTKHRPTALITLILATVNPWLFQFSRMGFDSLLSLFFYFLACYVFLHFHDWKKYFLASLLLMLGFLQYQGLKVVLPPLVIILTAYQVITSHHQSWTQTFQKNLPALFFLLINAALVVGFFLRLPSNSASRLQDMIFFNDNYISAQVNLKRQQGLANPYQEYFVNKFTVVTEELIARYLHSFNPTQLFIKGEPLRNPFSVWDYGIFHPADALLILIGLITVWNLLRGKEIGWLLVALIVIAPLPSAINIKDTWIMFRSSFLFPLLLILAAIGFSKLWHWLPKMGRVFLVLIYSLCVLNFFYQYFYRYPLYGTQGSYFAERVITSYTTRLGEDQPVVILGDESRFLWEEYLFYSGSITKQNLAEINKQTLNQTYELGNVRISTDCIQAEDIQAGKVIIAGNSVAFCQEDTPAALTQSPIAVPSLLDSGAIFTIYNDRLCQGYGLDAFAHVDKNVFAVEELSTEDFCRSFLIQN
ncbi:MAG TPA: hypothetical protein VF209_03560 [Patescibacteria group bacterium]